MHLSELQGFVDLRIMRHSQCVFAIEFYTRWDKLCNSDLATEKEQSLIPAHYFWADVVKIHFHWLLTQWSDDKYGYFGICGSTVNKLHKWIREIVCLPSG